MNLTAVHIALTMALAIASPTILIAGNQDSIVISSPIPAAHLSPSTLSTLPDSLPSAEIGSVDLDAIPVHRNLIQKIVNYFDHTNDKPKDPKKFDLSFIGGPYYSSDVKFGIGLVGSAQYRSQCGDTLALPSNVSLKAQVSTTLFYSFAFSGMHLSPCGKSRTNYILKFQSLPTYFWGVGNENARDDIKSKYKELSLFFNADYQLQVARNFYIGPMMDVKYITTRDRRDNLQLWDNEPLRTVSVGLGVQALYDTRDVITAPEKGVYLCLSQRFFPRFLGNSSHSFSSTEIEANYYQRIWPGGVLALRLHGNYTYGNTPWSMMPTFGDIGMRGYYLGRYRDKCETDLTIELRQHVWRRNGIVVWAGLGSVSPTLRKTLWKHILPNAGIGYRWEFKNRVNVRIDFGFGKGTTGFEFNINEAF